MSATFHRHLYGISTYEHPLRNDLWQHTQLQQIYFEIQQVQSLQNLALYIRHTTTSTVPNLTSNAPANTQAQTQLQTQAQARVQD